MAAPKRTKAERERDLVLVSRYYCQWYPQREIARLLNERPDVHYELSDRMIGYDIRAIKKAWREETTLNIDERRLQELARIDALEQTYYDAWLKSCEDAETARTTLVPSPDNPNNPDVAQRVIQTSSSTGDIRFLQGVQWCIRERQKLLGLEAPLKVAHTDPTGKKTYSEGVIDAVVTDDERMARVDRLFAVVGARASGILANPDDGDLGDEDDGLAPRKPTTK